MKTRLALRLGLSLYAALWIGIVPASAQNRFPLEMLNIKPVGSAPNGMPSSSRIYRAYPGLQYNIKAAVIGGNYPYSYVLSNAPSGMTVNASTGEINWPNPQGNASPTLTVTDQSGARVSGTWPITVSANGFRFIDANNGNDGGAGTLASPWRTVGRAKAAGSPGDIWVFRGGVYALQTTFGQLINPGTSRYQAYFNPSQNSTIWIAYPGETPVLDYGYGGNAGSGQYFPTISMEGGTTYVEGFETRNTQHFFFITGGIGQGPQFRKLTMHTQGYGWQESGSNASFLMFEHASPQSYGSVITDSVIYDGGLGVKHYDLLKPLISDNQFYDLINGIEEKAGPTQFTIRGNRFTNIGRSGALEWAIGGNMNSQNGYLVTGEVCFNLVRMANLSDEAYNFNWSSNSGTIAAYRNTFIGRVTAILVDSGDGPFTINNNVIVNNDNVPNRVWFDQVTDASRITISNNLVGDPSANIVDANGNLTGAYAQYVGTRGYQIGAGGGTTLPNAPRNLRVTP
ncbi:MAG TPA: Ig domain-containing protein [Vicinamibacterales bacterium]|nr:Ig domain-containing protein [Vicinamibacterales bacterium]